ncbi:MAG: glycolate oxidase subunit GlcE, partial [Proteobacteria bacterium]|nr:glycolate oxidase subunit GlcE [Pseudomonadota bacterium]
YWAEGTLFLRLSGAENAVVQTAKHWGGEPVSSATALWRQLREFEHPFFAGDKQLWRLSHKPTALVPKLGDVLIDWGGAQRWLRAEQDREALQRVAEEAGGHVSLFRGGDRTSELKHRLSKLEKTLQQRLKKAFDPEGILNPGRLYSWM